MRCKRLETKRLQAVNGRCDTILNISSFIVLYIYIEKPVGNMACGYEQTIKPMEESYLISCFMKIFTWSYYYLYYNGSKFSDTSNR